MEGPLRRPEAPPIGSSQAAERRGTGERPRRALSRDTVEMPLKVSLIPSCGKSPQEIYLRLYTPNQYRLYPLFAAKNTIFPRIIIPLRLSPNNSEKNDKKYINWKFKLYVVAKISRISMAHVEGWAGQDPTFSLVR